jgi:hypothetical protein
MSKYWIGNEPSSNVTSAQAKKIAADPASAIADYTITWTANAPTPGSTNTIDDGATVGDDNEGGQAIADLTAKLNSVLAALRTHGIISE